jgi:hypothetical protein
LEVRFYSGPGENNFAEQIWYGGGGGGGNRGFWFESGSGGGLGSGRAEQSRAEQAVCRGIEVLEQHFALPVGGSSSS